MPEDPPVIARNITLESDARGPRMVLDCALLADRVQIAAGVTVFAQHIVLSNCSIGMEKPLSFMRFNQGSQLVVQDSFLLQPTNLCLPHRQQLVALSTEPRPAGIPGTSQSLGVGQESTWCAARPDSQTAAAAGATGAAGTAVGPTATAAQNTSYSKLPQVFANRTGMGPAYAATLDQPARVGFYTHPT